VTLAANWICLFRFIEQPCVVLSAKTRLVIGTNYLTCFWFGSGTKHMQWHGPLRYP